MSKTINGKTFLRAVRFAFSVCPKSDAGAREQHVVFIDDRVVCSDRERWHVGYLPEGSGTKKPFAIIRASIEDLILGLDYTRKMSERSGNFEIKYNADQVTIKYGTKVLEHELLAADVGYIPEIWMPPVSDAAPLLQGDHAELHCGHVRDAMSWYRSWDKDHGTFKAYGDGGNKPVRYDLVAGGDIVAKAYLLPADRAPAVLPENEPLLDKARGGQKRGQSILDLIIDDGPLLKAKGDPTESTEALPDGDKKKKKAKPRRGDGEDDMRSDA